MGQPTQLASQIKTDEPSLSKRTLSTFGGNRIWNTIFVFREPMGVWFKQTLHYDVERNKFCNYKFYGNSHY